MVTTDRFRRLMWPSAGWWEQEYGHNYVSELTHSSKNQYPLGSGSLYSSYFRSSIWIITHYIHLSSMYVIHSSIFRIKHLFSSNSLYSSFFSLFTLNLTNICMIFNCGLKPTYNCNCIHVLATQKMAIWVAETRSWFLCNKIAFIHWGAFAGLSKNLCTSD
jgi:hypothetical protein